MKNDVKKIVVAFMIVISAGLCGCKEKGDDKVTVKEDKFDATKAFSIDDIDWSVEETIVNGDREVTLNYTNNTKYTILEIELDYVMKEDVSNDELAVFDDVKEELNWTDDDVKNLYMYSNNRKCAEPGESVIGSRSFINGYVYVDNIEQINVMDYDVMKIRFIGPGDKAYTIYYDFKNNDFSEDSSSPNELYQWSEYEISHMLPEMNFIEVELASDEEDRVHYHAYGVTNESFVAYKKMLIDEGFVNVEWESDDYYCVYNDKGYEVSLNYYAESEELSICIMVQEE